MPHPPDTADVQRLLDIMVRLRDPDTGCPWDAEQTFATIAPYTIEEAYEVADAIERGDMDHLRDELGDLLLQVVFHARMAAEAGHFDFADVARAICEKMIRRHPHVFGDAERGPIDSPAKQSRAWEAHKAEERRLAHENGKDDDGGPSVLDGVAIGLPALTRAAKLQRRAARVGFDWGAAAPVIAKIHEEIDELHDEMSAADGGTASRLDEEVGDLLFACANLARKLDIDPEGALRRGNAKFERRFRRIEALLAVQGRTAEAANLDEMEALWAQAKAEEVGGND